MFCEKWLILILIIARRILNFFQKYSILLFGIKFMIRTPFNKCFPVFFLLISKGVLFLSKSRI